MSIERVDIPEPNEHRLQGTIIPLHMGRRQILRPDLMTSGACVMDLLLPTSCAAKPHRPNARYGLMISLPV